MSNENMAEALLLGPSVEVTLQKIIAAATQHINLVFGSEHQETSFLNSIVKNLFSQSSQEETNLVKAIRQELEKLKLSLSKVQAVSVDKQGLQDKADIITHWLLKLGDLAYEADDALAVFEYRILQYEVLIQDQAKDNRGSSSSLSDPKNFRFQLLPRVRDVITKLEVINKEVKDFQILEEFDAASASRPQVQPSDQQKIDSLNVDRKIIGREDDVSKIVEMLTTPRNEVLSVFSLVGTNGVGKTTLVQSVFNNQRVLKIFDRRIWVDVSGAFKIKNLLKQILESLTQRVAEEEKIKDMVNRLDDELEKSRFLIVLDDIQKVKPEKWEEFKQKLMGIYKVRGNTILVITQNEQHAANVSALDSHFLQKLSPDHCWFIIKGKGHTGGETETSLELENIGRQIAEKCQGLPLAANLLGGLLQNKVKDFWLSVLESGVLDAENIVPEILKLIFEHLPSPFLQRCFGFTSMLSRNSVIERMQLVQLWMAEGFLDSGMSCDSMEEVGNQYFDILVHCSLLQAITTDKYNTITHCKMHNLVRDFASSISRFECINFDGSVKNEVPQIRHLALESFNKKNTKIVEENARHLRTLFLKSDVREDVLLDFNSLHVLNLSGVDIEKLPSFIDELTQLHYLDLSRTKINSLPDSICNLYKLQTLRITECGAVEEFPENFKNLLSLRHLHFYNESFHMPWEIGRLTNLQTLPMYNIGETKGSRIGELNSLKNLQGKLEIHYLELVRDKKEAEQADIFGKSSLRELQLHWSSARRVDHNDDKKQVALQRHPNNDKKEPDILKRHYNDENVLDGLQPHPNLRSLVIEYFMGDKFPSWLMNMSVCIDQGGQLDKLMEVKLKHCHQLQEIPTLGLLPLLHHLELSDLWAVTSIGPSFYDVNESKRSDNGSQIAEAYFPALRSLTLEYLFSLEDWKGVEETSATDEVELFPRLERLSIIHCDKLTTAPNQFPLLKELIIKDLNSSSPLENICCKATSLTNLQIHHVNSLICLPDGLLQKNPDLACLHIEDCQGLERIVSDTLCCGASLEELVIRNCGTLQELPVDLFDSLQSLEKLEISNCPELQSLPTSNGHEGLTSLCSLIISECAELTNIPSELVESCKNLQVLRVNDCENLTEFSVDLRKTPNLSYFVLCDCPELTSPPEGLWELNNLIDLRIDHLPNSSEFEAFQIWVFGLLKLSSLRRLSLGGQPEWDSLPEVLQHLPALKELTLECFGIESLPDWIEKLSSLQEINLYFCENLQYFPSKEIMQRLKKLRKLRIIECPQLFERWKQQNDPNSEWSKVSHIPKIFADDTEVSDPDCWMSL